MAKQLNLLPELSITSKGIRRKNPDYVWYAVDAMGAILSLVGRGNFTDRYIEGASVDSPWVSVMTRLESSLRFYIEDMRDFPYRITTDGYNVGDCKPMCFKVTTDEVQFKSLNSDFFKVTTDDIHFKSLNNASLLKYSRKNYCYFDTYITEDTPDIGVAHRLLIAVERGRVIFRGA